MGKRNDRKIDELRRDLAAHEKNDRDSHDEMTKDIVALQGEVKGCTARLDAHSKTLEAIQGDLKTIGTNITRLIDHDDHDEVKDSIAEVRAQVSDLKEKVDTLDRDVERNVEARESSAYWRKFLIERFAWWAIPLLLTGFVVMAAESLGVLNIIENKHETVVQEKEK